MSVAFDSDVTLTVEVRWSANPLATTGTWTDISAYVRELTVRRGRNHELDRIRAGTCQLTLDNRDGRFDPTYTSGAYYPNVLPMRQVRIRATHSAITYDLFTGYLWSFDPTWPNTGKDSITIAAGVDGFRILSQVYTQTLESQELSGARIGHILDDASWPATWRDLATGDVTCVAYQPQCESVLKLVQQVEDTEAGLFFMSGDGLATFQERSYRSGLSSSATFGDNQTTELPYVGLTGGYDDIQVWNRIEVTPDGGATSSSEDATSIGSYAKRTLKIHDTLHVDATASSSLASTLLARYKDPHVRVDSMTLAPRSDPSNLWPQVLGRELSDKITVNRRPDYGNTLSVAAYIEGVTHTVRAADRSWVTTFNLSQYD